MGYSARLVAPRVLWLVDTVIIAFALVIAICGADNIHLSLGLNAFLSSRITVHNLTRGALVLGVWTLLVYFNNLYRPDRLSIPSEAFRIVMAALVSTTVLFGSFGPTHQGATTADIALRFGFTCLVAPLLIRFLFSWMRGAALAGIHAKRSVIIAGTGPRALRMYRDLRTRQHVSRRLLGFMDSRGKEACSDEIASLYLGPLSQLESILVDNVVDEVLIALPARSCYGDIEKTVSVCARAGVEVNYPQDIFPGCNLQTTRKTDDIAMINIRSAPYDSRLLVKRCLDIVCSLTALVLLAPLMLVVAIAVRATSPGPILFSQERYGLGRRRFRMYKFRSMVADAEAKLKDLEKMNEAQGPIFKIRNDPRMTKIGAILRRTSLDELPQLFNVFMGDMALVGPRPMSVRDVNLFDESWLMRRFSVKPGLTCLWQVNGRSSTTFDRWMELDLRYIDTWSLRLDARIIALTIPAILKGSGAM